MVQTSTIKKVVVITGPTAIGKTDISIEIAKRFNMEIINSDASQFKKDLNIGTAKVDLNGCPVKHHLIDIIDPTEYYSISDYQRKGRMIINDLFNSGITPLIVGGSGLYINALLYDYDLSSEKRSNDGYLDMNNEELHKLLSTLDEVASQKIPINNRKRLTRAIELAKSGKKISENICNDETIIPSLFICLNCDRALLYERINKRVDKMFETGWIQECLQLKELGYNLDEITDIGYKEINMYLNGLLTLDEAKEIIKKNTRHYAKRQLTWFRNKMNCVFVEMDYYNIEKTINEISRHVKDFL